MSMRPMKFWPTSLPSVILAPHRLLSLARHERVGVGGAEAGAVVGALAELGGVDAVPHLLLVLDGDVAGLEVLGDLGDDADLVLGALVGVALLGPPGEAALLGEGAGVVEVLGLEALVGVLGGDEGEGLALEEGGHPRPVGGEGEAHVAAVEVGEGVEALGVGPEVVGAARALELPERVGLWPRGHLGFFVCVFCGQPFIASLFFF